MTQIDRLRPGEIPFNLHELPVVVSYPDGEGALIGVGVAVWIPGHEVLAGYLQTPPELRKAWARPEGSVGDERDIYEIEPAGPLLVVENFGHLMQRKLWFHLCDNEAALATLIKGSSSVMAGDFVAAATHSLVGKHCVWPWFDRVDTESIPVGRLSCRNLAGDWKLVPIAFPKHFVSSISAFLAPIP